MATITTSSTAHGLQASTRVPFSSRPFLGARRISSSSLRVNQRPALQRGTLRPQALLGDSSDEDTGDKKFLTREEEPEQYWVSKGEAKGVNPLKDPLAVIGILAIFFPFGLLLVAIATGLIDTSVYRY